MPCNQQILNQTTFVQGTDLDMLTGALQDAGYMVQRYGETLMFSSPNKFGTGSFKDGLFSAPQDWEINPVKKAYSVRSVKESARKMGWTVRQNPKDQNRLQIVKRY